MGDIAKVDQSWANDVFVQTPNGLRLLGTISANGTLTFATGGQRGTISNWPGATTTLKKMPAELLPGPK